MKKIILAIFMLAFPIIAEAAAAGNLTGLRTGIQPNHRSRLVIETTTRPVYSIAFGQNQFTVTINNMRAPNAINPSMGAGTIVRSVTHAAAGNNLTVTANLTANVRSIPANQIQVLPPSGTTGFRLVIDFAGEGTAAAAPAANRAATNNAARRPVIVIDPGHGGRDPGAIGRGGAREKDIVLAVSRRLRDRLVAAGFTVVMTRETDIFLNLATRAAIAERHNADLFLSIHVNANPSRAMRGWSLFTLSKVASDEEARRVAEAENAADRMGVDGFETLPDALQGTLASLQMQAVEHISMAFAQSLARQKNQRNLVQQPGPAVRRAAFAVLRSTSPGVLIELGHISNAEEERLLQQTAHQNRLIDAIVAAVRAHNFEI